MKRVAIVLLWLLACGGKENRPVVAPDRPSTGSAPNPTNPTAHLDSPEALAKAFLEALASADPARVRALYMTPEHIAALVSCEKDPVIELREHLVEVERQLKPTTSTIEFDGWVQTGRSVLAAGTKRDGCTAKRDFELATGSVKFTVTSKAGSAMPTGDVGSKLLAVVKVDDTWRVWRMSSL